MNYIFVKKQASTPPPATLWTPSNLSTTPEYWLDANALTGLSDGDQLDSWTNQGALAAMDRDATNSEPGYPKYRTGQLNSMPGIEWPAANASYGTRMFHGVPYVSAAGNLTDITIVAVVRSTDTGSSNQIIARSGYYELINGRVSGKFSASFWNGQFNTTAGTTAINTASSYVVAAQWDKTAQTRTLWVNGGQDAQSTSLGSNTYNINMQPILGSNAYGSTSGGQTFSGFMFEVVVLHETIAAGSPSEKEKLEGYMAHKWGLASSLPTGHPYKSAAPTA